MRVEHDYTMHVKAAKTTWLGIKMSLTVRCIYAADFTCLAKQSGWCRSFFRQSMSGSIKTAHKKTENRA